MQNAETVLGVLRERGKKGLPLDELYRQLFNPQLYLLAYGRIYANDGAMTPGTTPETVDGMSLDKIRAIIDAVRHERYRFSPVRRIYIPKKNGKLRPLGLPAWSDKLVGEVVRLLLEAYYEPQFSGRSHGFRPRRGCHTALREVADTWSGTAWFVEGDVADCFGSFDQEIMISILAEKIHDNRFLRLMRNMLTAGYLEDWRWNATLSGAPQGGVVSLVNVALHGMEKAAGVRYFYRSRGGIETAPESPVLVRYADDLVALCHSRQHAEEVKARLAAWLAPRGLAFNEDKTRIVHLEDGGFDFLGFNVRRYHGRLVLIKPSKEAVRRILERLRTEMRALRGSNAAGVLKKLTPITRG